MPYEMIEEEVPEESLTQSGLRNVARQGTNIATRAVGIPGDIFSLINEYVANPIVEKFGGKKVPYESTPLGKVLPTTETHRKGIEKKTGEFLKPQNEIEKFTDDIIEDAATLFNPVGLAKGTVKAVPSIIKNLGKSIGSNFLGETVKQNLGREDAGIGTKAGTLFLLSLFDQEATAKTVGKLYSQAEAHIPKGATTSANRLEVGLGQLEHSITKGRPKNSISPPEKFVIDQIDKVRPLIVEGKIPIEQLIAQKRSLHKELATLYREVPKLGDQKNVKHLAKRMSGYFNEAIEQYGKTNPKFFKPYKNADQAFGTLAQSNFMSNWVESNLLQHPVTTGLMHVLAPIGGLAAKALIPYQAAKVTYRIAKSPTLAKIYANTVKAAAKEDVATFNKYAKELDKALQEEETKDEYEFID